MQRMTQSGQMAEPFGPVMICAPISSALLPQKEQVGILELPFVLSAILSPRDS